MNQIICSSSSKLENLSKVHKKQGKFILIFLFCIIVSILLIAYYALFRYDLYKSERLSKKLLDSYNMTNLYPTTNNYTAIRTNKGILPNDYSNLNNLIIGIVEIKKINIVYPILSDVSKKNLKISPCKFYGPNPNTVGNLCIAAHNYKNETFFSNLSSLANGDIVTIYDNYENQVDYVVYKVYTAHSTDIECINQNTNGLKIITLITCDSLNNKYRTIVKAKEI